MSYPLRLPAAPRDRPYREEDLDRLLEGRDFTFDELAAALVLVVPPLDALLYLRRLSSRRALHETGTDPAGTKLVTLRRDHELAAC